MPSEKRFDTWDSTYTVDSRGVLVSTSSSSLLSYETRPDIMLPGVVLHSVAVASPDWKIEKTWKRQLFSEDRVSSKSQTIIVSEKLG